jgi:hypothetical protein
MKLLALERERPQAQAQDFQPLLQAEARRAWELTQAGLLREIYFRADRSQAVLVLECDTLAAAQAALDSLPLVQAGLIEFEIIPLRPYPGFERLFGQPGKASDKPGKTAA